mmetsp:Transcript_5886/g.14218  ORF Transcript_5886/g.14218 Transcript_5886/m.14218 type:complete len:239 (+) Transcript_5886:716-1432(+)
MVVPSSFSSCPGVICGFVNSPCFLLSSSLFASSSSSVVTTVIPFCRAIIRFTCNEKSLIACSLGSSSSSSSPSSFSLSSFPSSLLSAAFSTFSCESLSMFMSSSLSSSPSSSSSSSCSLSYSSCAARATDLDKEYRWWLSGSAKKRDVSEAVAFLVFVPPKKNPGSSPRACRSEKAWRRSSGEIASDSSSLLTSNRSAVCLRAAKTNRWAYSLASVLTTTVISWAWPGATNSDKTSRR